MTRPSSLAEPIIKINEKIPKMSDSTPEKTIAKSKDRKFVTLKQKIRVEMKNTHGMRETISS